MSNRPRFPGLGSGKRNDDDDDDKDRQPSGGSRFSSPLNRGGSPNRPDDKKKDDKTGGFRPSSGAFGSRSSFGRKDNDEDEDEDRNRDRKFNRPGGSAFGSKRPFGRPGDDEEEDEEELQEEEEEEDSGPPRSTFGNRPGGSAFGSKPGAPFGGGKPADRPGSGSAFGNKPGSSFGGGKPGDKPGGSAFGNKPGSSFGSKPGSKPSGSGFGSKPGDKPGGSAFGNKPGGSGFGSKPGSPFGGGKPGDKPGGSGFGSKPGSPFGSRSGEPPRTGSPFSSSKPATRDADKGKKEEKPAGGGLFGGRLPFGGSKPADKKKDDKTAAPAARSPFGARPAEKKEEKPAGGGLLGGRLPFGGSKPADKKKDDIAAAPARSPFGARPAEKKEDKPAGGGLFGGRLPFGGGKTEEDKSAAKPGDFKRTTGTTSAFGRPSGSTPAASARPGSVATPLKTATTADLKKPVSKVPPARGEKVAKPLERTSKQVTVQHGLSLDQKLDLIGYALMGLGIITFITAMWPNEGVLPKVWGDILGGLFGLGRYVIWFPPLAVGLWLFISRFDENPLVIKTHRIVGWVLLLLTLVTTAHFVVMLQHPVENMAQLVKASDAVAKAHDGGGWIGGELYKLLIQISGEYIIVVVLVGMWLISIMASFSITMPELFVYIKSVFVWFGRVRRSFVEHRRAAAQAKAAAAPPLTIEKPVPGALPAGATPAAATLAAPARKTDTAEVASEPELVPAAQPVAVGVQAPAESASTGASGGSRRRLPFGKAPTAPPKPKEKEPVEDSLDQEPTPPVPAAQPAPAPLGSRPSTPVATPVVAAAAAKPAEEKAEGEAPKPGLFGARVASLAGGAKPGPFGTKPAASATRTAEELEDETDEEDFEDQEAAPIVKPSPVAAKPASPFGKKPASDADSEEPADSAKRPGSVFGAKPTTTAAAAAPGGKTGPLTAAKPSDGDEVEEDLEELDEVEEKKPASPFKPATPIGSKSPFGAKPGGSPLAKAAGKQEAEDEVDETDEAGEDEEKKPASPFRPATPIGGKSPFGVKPGGSPLVKTTGKQEAEDEVDEVDEAGEAEEKKPASPFRPATPIGSKSPFGAKPGGVGGSPFARPGGDEEDEQDEVDEKAEADEKQTASPFKPATPIGNRPSVFGKPPTAMTRPAPKPGSVVAPSSEEEGEGDEDDDEPKYVDVDDPDSGLQPGGSHPPVVGLPGSPGAPGAPLPRPGAPLASRPGSKPSMALPPAKPEEPRAQQPAVTADKPAAPTSSAAEAAPSAKPEANAKPDAPVLQPPTPQSAARPSAPTAPVPTAPSPAKPEAPTAAAPTKQEASAASPATVPPAGTKVAPASEAPGTPGATSAPGGPLPAAKPATDATIQPPAASDPPKPETPAPPAASSAGPSPAPSQVESVLVRSKAPHGWALPDFRQVLEVGSENKIADEVIQERVRVIEDTLQAFGAPGKVVDISPGPVITQFGVEPDYLVSRQGKKTRVKVSAIARLDADLALALAARSIRIEAPVPGKGYVGIEVPNAETALVSLRDIMESEAFQKLDSKLRISLGLSVDGAPIAADLTQMPHLLIAGTTGSGKSVCVNAIISCLLLMNTPDDIKMIMIDPKRVELTSYNGIPHLIAPVVVDLERIVGVLKWVSREMDERYKRFSAAGARNIADYNSRIGPNDPRLPYLVVVVDELADLMMLAPEETEKVLTRLAQMARATGIHLIISTQRPSVDVVTGLIKANFPARISFAVASSVDSRVILDQPGAEKLLGRGDMLYQSPDAAAPLRMQGVFVSDAEMNRITSYWKGARSGSGDGQPGPAAAQPATVFELNKSAEPIQSRAERFRPPDALQSQKPLGAVTGEGERLNPPASAGGNGSSASDDDEMYEEAVDLVKRMNKASISLLQRRLRIGYTRAARLIELMEQRGVIGAEDSGDGLRRTLSDEEDSDDEDGEH